MFRKKQKQYIKDPQKIYSIVSSNPSQPEPALENKHEMLNLKFQAYTSFHPNHTPHYFATSASEVKAESFLKKCHIIDSVDILFKTVELLQDNRNSMEEKGGQRERQRNKENYKQLASSATTSIRQRFKEEISQRKEYQKLIQEIRGEMEVLGQVNMKPTQIFIYKQQLLSVYFERVIEQLGKECKQKAYSIQIIWNSMIDIMEKMLKALLSKVNQEEERKFNGFHSVHDDLSHNIEKVTKATHILKQKLDIKNKMINDFEKKIEENKKTIQKMEEQGGGQKNYLMNRSLFGPHETKEESTQTYQKKEKTSIITPKTFDSIGVSVKPTRFQKTVAVQTMKQLSFDINCIQVTVISQKPKKSSLEERQTAKGSQTMKQLFEDVSVQTEQNLKETISTIKPRASKESSIRKSSMFLDKTLVIEKFQKLKSINEYDSQSDFKPITKTTYKPIKKKTGANSLIGKHIKSLENQDILSEEDAPSEFDEYMEINLNHMYKTTAPSGYGPNNRASKSNTSHIKKGESQIISEKPSIRKSISTAWNKERKKNKSSLSEHTFGKEVGSCTSHVEVLPKSSFVQVLPKSSFGKKREGHVKLVKSMNEQIECIIQLNVRQPEYQRKQDSIVHLRDSIYSSFSEKISSFRRPVNLEKNSGVCKIISQLYPMAYEKITRGKGIQFVDTIFDYFTISYGAHNKKFVIDKVSYFLMEAKEMESSNIHIQLFCLLAKLTKYPQTDDLLPQDFELCIKLLVELNCDKKGFYIETNFTTVQKLKSISQPLIAKCIGANKAKDLNRTMETLITRSIQSKEDKNLYRISVSSTILFVLNRIAKQRSQYCKKLNKLVRFFRNPLSSGIDIRVLEIMLKYLNINKLLYIASCIKFKNQMQIKNTIKMSSFITYLMRIDYPFPHNTKVHLYDRFKFEPKRFGSREEQILYLNQFSTVAAPLISQNIIENIGQDSTDEELTYLQELLTFYKLEEEANLLLVTVIGDDLQQVFCASLGLLIKDS